jgi:hypothetical protein
MPVGAVPNSAPTPPPYAPKGTSMTSPRNTLYALLMVDGIHGRGHSPDRSERASELLDAYRDEIRREAAAEQRSALLREGYDLSCRCDGCTACLVRYAIAAIDAESDYYEDVAE